MASIRTAVVGHVEWVTFARVPHMPAAGEIVHVSELWEESGGGGGVAAVQLVKLAGHCAFLTALADDEPGRRSADVLRERGVEVHAAARAEPQRRVFVHVDDDGERTITVIGDRMVPHGDDELAWDSLAGVDALYFTGGDAAALRASRAARVLVATPRAAATLQEARVQLDALVHSGTDAGEQLDPGSLDPPPRLVVSTLGGEGGRWEAAEGRTGTWKAAELEGPRVNAYGAGDSFAAGLTYGLAACANVDEAVQLAARCGAAKLGGHGATDNQLTLARR
jgi:ribokinase